MLYYFLYSLHSVIPPFRVFQYITFRTAAAYLTALLICLVMGPWVIRRLRQFQIGQQIREDGPSSHKTKAGTPTMGGILILIGILTATLLWGNLTNLYVWLAMIATLLFGIVGFLDDYSKVTRKRSLGHDGKSQDRVAGDDRTRDLRLPLLPVRPGAFTAPGSASLSSRISRRSSAYGSCPEFHWRFLSSFFVLFILVGVSNAVNLTDGLDGLASGCVIIAASALTVLTYVTGHARMAEYLDLFKNPYSAELTIFCGAMVGATMGFLWYNAHPAQVFMGDVGSQSLGGAIGAVAVLIKQELLLPMIGGVFVLEALSVILQVASFKFTGRRIFRMAPVHHHFELGGWTESQVVIRFWIMAIFFALFSLTTLKLR